MKKTMVISAVTLVGILAVAHADKGATATLTAASDLKWSAVPNMAGVKIAVGDGDPSKGASHFFLKFDKGFTAGEHHHTSDHSGTVVAGTLILTVDGKDNLVLRVQRQEGARHQVRSRCGLHPIDGCTGCVGRGPRACREKADQVVRRERRSRSLARPRW